jgi:type I protein arginine methyltransferase
MSEYSLQDYGKMIHDRVRTDAYARALERLVRPGSVVLDIGAGSGILALMAARAGARRVFAVEKGEIAALARELAAANGYADTIEFMAALSTRIKLPEPADVIVSDLHGVLPLYRAHIPSIVDARRRHLARAGTLIPFRDTLWVAPAELASVYEDSISWWETSPYGFDIAAARVFAVNAWRKVSAPASALFADPERLAVLDYRSVSSPNLKASAESQSTRSGTLHGVLAWFDSELAEDVGFSNAPGEPETIYGQAFFPLQEPVDVTPGDMISLDFSASLFGDEYVFRWDTRITEPSNQSRAKAAFTQSTLFAAPLSPESLAKRGEGYAPARTEDGEAVRFVLERVDGQRTLDELSREVEGRFHQLFDSADDALRFVTEVTRKHCH